MKYQLIFLCYLLTSCSLMGKPEQALCEKGISNAQGIPCWVLSAPDEGVVVNMAQHVDPNKTREILFKQGLLEIAAAQTGAEVSENAIVKKWTHVDQNDAVTQSATVTSLATVSYGNESISVRARIKDAWTHPKTEKLFLWIIPVK